MKRTLLFVGFLLIVLVMFTNLHEGLVAEGIPFDTATRKKAIFDELLILKDFPMSDLQNHPLLSTSFNQSIHSFITPEELKSKTR